MSIFLFPIVTVLLRPVEHGLFRVCVGLGEGVIFTHGSYLWISIFGTVILQDESFLKI